MDLKKIVKEYIKTTQYYKTKKRISKQKEVSPSK